MLKLVLLWTLFIGSFGDLASVTIKTSFGMIKGSVHPVTSTEAPYIPSEVHSFYNIPFAEPPINDLRFKAPVDITPSTYKYKGIRDATVGTMPPLCTQDVGPKLRSEDCLYMNICKPKGASDSSLVPVMFYITEGRFFDGGASIHSCISMAGTYDVIVVMTNYRVGPLGFMASKALKAEDTHSSTGNYGTQDQQSAMRWVQKYIEDFGGNKDQVTIYGASSGAMSVYYHLVSTQSHGLFHGAIATSGSVNEIFFPALDHAYDIGDWMASMAGCPNASSLECLRNVDAEKFIIKENFLTDYYADATRKAKDLPLIASALFPVAFIGPVVDGVQLKDAPLKLMKQGKVNRVPLVAGNAKNEGSLFVILANDVDPWVSFPPMEGSFYDLLMQLSDRNVSLVNGIGKLYNVSFEDCSLKNFNPNNLCMNGLTSKEEYPPIEQFLTDLIFTSYTPTICGIWEGLQLPCWLYSHTEPLLPELLQKIQIKGGEGLEVGVFGAFHTGDTYLVFREFAPLSNMVRKEVSNIVDGKKISLSSDIIFDIEMATDSVFKGHFPTMQLMSQLMASCISNMVHTQDPSKYPTIANSSKYNTSFNEMFATYKPEIVKSWPKYTKEDQKYMRFQVSNGGPAIIEMPSSHVRTPEFPSKAVSDYILNDVSLMYHVRFKFGPHVQPMDWETLLPSQKSDTGGASAMSMPSSVLFLLLSFIVFM